MNVISLFERIVKEKGSETAVVDLDGERKTGFSKLDELSGRVAGKLKALGCRKGSFVVLNFERRVEYYAAVLGVLKAGCAYVPTVPAYPQERIDYIVNDCHAFTVMKIDFFDDIDKYEMYSASAGENDPALLIYTSGSTGKPKGIVHTVRGFLAAIPRWWYIAGDMDGFSALSITSFSFVASTRELFTYLLKGVCIHLVTKEIFGSIDALVGYINAHNIQMANLTTGMLRLVYQKDLCLKRVTTGSELVAGIYSDKYEIRNIFGMSETLSSFSYFILDKAYDDTPLGKAPEDTIIHIIDNDGKEMPNNTQGEICIEGVFGASYFNNPELTAKTFVRLENGKTLIHTGDIGYKDDNDDLVFVSRKDWMIKINGQRVEILEVERRINEIEGVNLNAVRSFTDSNAQTYIASYYTTNTDITPEKLREELSKKLPEYMVPRFFVKLAELPKTVSGKLDRSSLLPPDISNMQDKYEAPENETEEKLCRAFENVLKSSGIGRNDDFFVLGGDSIKVLMLLEETGIKALSPDMILLGRTPARICELLKEGTDEEIEALGKIPENCPLTEAQVGIYLECVSEPQSVMYNIVKVCPLPEKTDIPKFIEAVKAVVKAHKSFMLTTGITDGVPMMKYKESEVQVPQVSAQSLDSEVKRFIMPHDLENGPLFSFEICHHNEGAAFIFDIHHLIFDGTSVNNFITEIAGVYAGEMPKEEKLTMFDISAYETGIKQKKKYADAKQFFEKEFRDIECETTIISDRIEVDKPSGAETVTMSTEGIFDSEIIRSFIKSRRITENTLFLGAFAYTLAKFAGAEKCCFNAANNGRHDARLMDSVGMFVKTLPLHFEFDETQRTDDFLSDVQKYFFETMKYDCISFGELAREYGLNNSISFVYQADLFEGATIEGKIVKPEGVETGDVQSDLVVMMIKNGENYTAYAHYKKELYSDKLIGSFINTYVNVINSMLSAYSLEEISFLDEKTQNLLDEFNKTDVDFDKSLSVVDLFRKQAAATPDNVAIIFRNKEYTYRFIDELSDKICGYLIAHGVMKGDVVSVMINRGVFMPAASLGILKCGAAYQPLDPTYPSDRLEFMMVDASVKYLIADKGLMEKIPNYNGAVLFTEDALNLELQEYEPVTIKRNDLLVLLYTSGSTGTPKGCMLEHGNLAAFCNWYKRFYGVDETSRVAAYASYGFDACLMDMYPVLTAGGACVIIPEDARMNMMMMEDIFVKAGVTHSFLTTQIGRLFATECKVPTLKHLSIGGEKLIPITPPEGYAFYNVYGPTECTIFSTAFRQDKEYTRVPIGRQVDNMKIYVVDEKMRRLPPYMPGELCISSIQVTGGYLNRPEKTESVYRINPFSKDSDYSRLYRTGDVVRMMSDGNIDFIGRNDNQKKIRGFRVELDEIENKILSFDNVSAVKVVMRNNGIENYLAAFLVSSDGKEIHIDRLKDYLKSIVPPYMIPSFLVQLEKMPLNVNGKIDVKKLPETNEDEKEREYVEPKTPTEKDFCEIFAEVLGLKRVGITDDFFELGGTSLSAIKVVTHASAKGYSILYRDIFKNSTPRMIAEFLGNDQTEGSLAQDKALADYDYGKINKLLEKDRLENVDSITKCDPGDIILTGAVGFLGIHILHEFLTSYAGKVYCIMRVGNYPSIEARLQAMLTYYFGKSYEEMFGNRIECIEGDITDTLSLKTLEMLPAGMIVNAAACVKHFANDDILDRVNAQAVKNLCDICVRSKKRLVHISTVSTAGIIRKSEQQPVYREDELYFGQTIDSAYSKSKFMGERILLEYKCEKGLDGCIVRVGNLMPRAADGEFQINFMTNNFLGVLRAYTKFEAFPVTAMYNSIDFSPIDYTARAVLTLGASKSDFSVFHAYNNHSIFMADVVYVLKKMGFNLDIVSSDSFAKILEEGKMDDSKSNEILRLTAYSRNDTQAVAVGSDNRFTTEVLYRLDFKWPIIDEAYLENAITKLKGLRFFR